MQELHFVSEILSKLPPEHLSLVREGSFYLLPPAVDFCGILQADIPHHAVGCRIKYHMCFFSL